MRLRFLLIVVLSLPAFGAEGILFYHEKTDTSGFGSFLPNGVFAFALKGTPQFLELDENVIRDFARADQAIKQDVVWRFNAPEHENSKLLLDPVEAMIWIDENGVGETCVAVDRFFLPPTNRVAVTSLLEPMPQRDPRTHLERYRYYVTFNEKLLVPVEKARHPRFLLDSPNGQFEMPVVVTTIERGKIHNQEFWLARVLPEDVYTGAVERDVPPRFVPLSLLRTIHPTEAAFSFNPLYTVVYNSLIFWDRFPQSEVLDDRCLRQLEAIINARRHVLVQ